MAIAKAHIKSWAAGGESETAELKMEHQFRLSNRCRYETLSPF